MIVLILQLGEQQAIAKILVIAQVVILLTEIASRDVGKTVYKLCICYLRRLRLPAYNRQLQLMLLQRIQSPSQQERCSAILRHTPDFLLHIKFIKIKAYLCLPAIAVCDFHLLHGDLNRG